MRSKRPNLRGLLLIDDVISFFSVPPFFCFREVGYIYKHSASYNWICVVFFLLLLHRVAGLFSTVCFHFGVSHGLECLGLVRQ